MWFVFFNHVSHWLTTLQSRQNEHGGVSNHQPHYFTQAFIQGHIRESIKAPRHWPLCGEFTGDRWIPRTKGRDKFDAILWRQFQMHSLEWKYINFDWNFTEVFLKVSPIHDMVIRSDMNIWKMLEVGSFLISREGHIVLVSGVAY